LGASAPSGFFGGNHYSHLKVTVEGSLNGIVNEINKAKVRGNSGIVPGMFADAQHQHK